jgi:hypothetical protein
MPLTNAGMILAADALRAGMAAAQLHSADPGTDGVGLEVGGRQAIAWNAATGNGDFDLASAVNYTGLGAGQAVTYVSFWSQVAAGGTCYGVYPTQGDQAANAAGEYTLAEHTMDGNAT